MLAGKRILLGITGGIAAYKIPELIRFLKAAGAEVKVVCSPQALDFVTPLTLSVVSENPVVHSLFDSNSGEWVNHVNLALWADLLILAPLTANSFSALVNGKADNAVLVTTLCARCPVILVPAMDHDMWLHESTLCNIKRAQEIGYTVVEPDYGPLASGLVGHGRMPQPIALMQYLTFFQKLNPWWKGKRILISSGGTREAIDPVRYISNHSTGKMGVALAEAAYSNGAEVVLVRTKGSKTPVFQGIKCIEVETAVQMQRAISDVANEQDVIAMAAAVADYRIANLSPLKIKKSVEGFPSLEWVENPDILKGLATTHRNYFLLGFALESTGSIEQAKIKFNQKGVDLLALNSLETPGAGFEVDTNKITLITSDSSHELDLKSKKEIAVEILNFVAECIIKSR
jgi:phosphopantothenoylcysteine decarboxylase/phosphopantothenate--cysteine ligase